jgi:5-methylcytosine-specific restriction enzyme A
LDGIKLEPRKLKGGAARGKELPKGPSGRNLCRWCELEVPKGRVTFCSDFCVEEWRLRTDVSFLREKTLARDKGICALCAVDTIAEYFALKRSRGGHKARLLQRWGLKTLNRRTLWDADHIVPVAEGGGACDLSNIRTLCLICHREATRQLRERLAQRVARNL